MYWLTACVCVDRREPQDWLPAPHTLLLILHHYTLQWLLHTAHRTLHTARPLQQRSLPARRADFHIVTYLPYSTTACLHCVFVVQHPSKTPPKEDRSRAFCIPNYPPTHSLDERSTHATLGPRSAPVATITLIALSLVARHGRGREQDIHYYLRRWWVRKVFHHTASGSQSVDA